MNYDKNNATSRENKGYRSNTNASMVGRQIGNQIDSQRYRDAADKRMREKAIKENNEKGYTAQLLELGKLCGFVECFDGILLADQNIEQIGPFVNPRECESFIEGYKYGKMLVAQGLPKQAYHDHASNYENKYNSNRRQK